MMRIKWIGIEGERGRIKLINKIPFKLPQINYLIIQELSKKKEMN